ncbi:MAG: glycine cleavage system aminomethyltransferase GcvT [Sandaracinaceae bacterium]|nr:glycine cleavage system aminomethyltransferase GcvT [Sandaracinaceae bacterium]
MVPFAGWEMPVQYEGVIAEHNAVRNAAGLFDVCHMGELILEGEHAIAVVDYLVTNDIKGLSDGQARYTACCNAEGTILDDLIIYRHSPTKVLVVCNASNVEKISKHFEKAAKDHCEFRDVSEETALIALQGPRAADVIWDAKCAASTQKLASFHFAKDQVGGVDCTVARTGYTGEDGFELFCAWNDAPKLWRALMEAGKKHGLAPIGLGARDTLRLEARLSLYGNDIDETTNPLEAGLGWVTKFDKGDFVGREALAAIKEAGLTRKIVGFEMTGRGIGRHGYPITDAAAKHVGIVTSGSPGPTVGKNIGLGYVPTAMSEVGTKIGIEIRGKVIDAVVVKTPFYKRKKD